MMLRSALNIVRTYGPGARPLLRASRKPVSCFSGQRCLSTSLLASPPVLARLRPQLQHRYIWGWLNAIFNKVDADRINDVGPDRACAEWLLRCGAHFRWRSQPDWQKDYNTLSPITGRKKQYIEEINADNAALMDIGFHHFKGLSSVRKIRFHYCGYLEDPALVYLSYLSHCLEWLEISSCGNITMVGLRHLASLTHLKELHLYDLPEIEDRDACVRELQQLLPGCHVTFPPPRGRSNANKNKEPPPAPTPPHGGKK
ncbi:ATP synthase subunit s, mitochondrial-like isoform X2 [Amphibalanus amphitrite]|uniref:ATP synthase subunit s, mitochondrial-like isoform X2 n=1 Tax=Amphibalanus amphitrite TaxID=1232801 RepID=UPI001C9257EB|nr:ATP synthase subunit s, mitochondrial-like isoform X2 [Amphibalanus amphitrite]